MTTAGPTDTPIFPAPSIQPDGYTHYHMEDCNRPDCYALDDAGCADHTIQCPNLRVSVYGVFCAGRM